MAEEAPRPAQHRQLPGAARTDEQRLDEHHDLDDEPEPDHEHDGVHDHDDLDHEQHDDPPDHHDHEHDHHDPATPSTPTHHHDPTAPSTTLSTRPRRCSRAARRKEPSRATGSWLVFATWRGRQRGMKRVHV